MSECKMFLIEEEEVKSSTITQKQFIYCPLEALRYIISNTDDEHMHWFIITRAFDLEKGEYVKPSDVFKKSYIIGA